MLGNNYPKQSPIVGVTGLGGGINSYIFLSSGGDYIISRSLRFNSADTSYLSKTFSSDGNRRTNTISFWIKKVKIDASASFYRIFGSQQASHIYLYEDKIFWDASTTDNNSAAGYRWTNRLFRDPSAWYHIVCTLDTTQSTASDRMRLYVNGVEETSFQGTANMGQNDQTGFSQGSIEHTFGYRSSNQGSAGGALDAYLADIHFVDGQALAPTSFGETDDNGVWQPKKFSGAHGTNGFHLDFADNSSDAALGYDAAGSNNFTVNNLTATGGAATNGIAFDGNDKVTFPGMDLGTGNLTFECFFKLDSGTSGFRRIMSRTDGGSGNDMIIRVHTNGYMQWYFDSQEHTGSTTVTTGVWHHSAIVRSGSDTISYYYDGTRISTATSNADMTLNAVILAWGHGSEYFTGQIYGARITKQALYTGASYTVPTSAITTTSQGAVSSNVVHLSATTSTTTTNSGTTGNGTNDGDPSAVSAYPFGGGAENIDSLIDSPSQSVADETDTGVGGQITGNYATYNNVRVGSGTKSNGNLTVTGSGQVPDVASIAPNSGKWYAEIKWDSGSYARVGLQDVNIPTSDFGGVNGESYRYESNSGNVQPGGQTYSTYAAGDIIGVAFDCDAGKLWLAKNGTWQNSGDPAGGTGAVATNLVAGKHYAPANSSGSGSSVFTLNAGQRAFAYTAPTGFKCLTVENLATPTIADGSKYFDVALDTGANILSAATGKTDNAGFVWIKDRDNNSTNHILFNKVNDAGMDGTPHMRSNTTQSETTCGTYSAPSGNSVAWVWNGGTSFSNSAGSNGATVATSGIANPAAGFSIVKWTGSGANATLAHGLQSPPAMIIQKRFTNPDSWHVYHESAGNTHYARLENTDDFEPRASAWNNTSPTSSVFSVGDDGGVNGTGNDYLAHCFAPVAGYSSFGGYTGNGSADGIFIYTGFAPRWLLFKRSDSTSDWSIYDTARDPHNVAGDKLEPNTTDNESPEGAVVDILSNGFKFRRNSLENGGNDVYIYAAFASHPFKTARAR